MARNRADLVKWALQKSVEYLESAQANIEAERLFPAAEEVFRSVENSLEALLYSRGVKRIEYPGTRGKFTGRLALQFLIRDSLVRTGILEQDVYDRYLDMAAQLHRAGYRHNMTFSNEELRTHAKFAEALLTKVNLLISG